MDEWPTVLYAFTFIFRIAQDPRSRPTVNQFGTLTLSLFNRQPP